MARHKTYKLTFTLFSHPIELSTPSRQTLSSNMKLSLNLTVLFLVLSYAQTYPECTAEVARTDDCASVINANACYNKFRFNAQTLTCIDGTDDAVKQKKVRVQNEIS